jgi:hypothetical protein
LESAGFAFGSLPASAWRPHDQQINASLAVLSGRTEFLALSIPLRVGLGRIPPFDTVATHLA